MMMRHEGALEGRAAVACIIIALQQGSMAGLTQLTQLASQVSDTAGEIFTYDLESCVRPCDALTPSPSDPNSSPVRLLPGTTRRRRRHRQVG